MHQNAEYPRFRGDLRLVPGQSRLRGRSRRHPSLATDAQAWARAVWTPCLPQPRPAISNGAANLRISPSSADCLAHVRHQYARFASRPASGDLLAFRTLRVRITSPYPAAVFRGPLPSRRLRSITEMPITLPRGPTGVSVAASRV